MLMAWCSTLGGAHSSLGEDFAVHVSVDITAITCDSSVVMHLRVL